MNNIEYLSSSGLLAQKRNLKVYNGKYMPLPSLKQRMEVVSYSVNRKFYIAPIKRLR